MWNALGSRGSALQPGGTAEVGMGGSAGAGGRRPWAEGLRGRREHGPAAGAWICQPGGLEEIRNRHDLQNLEEKRCKKSPFHILKVELELSPKPKYRDHETPLPPSREQTRKEPACPRQGGVGELRGWGLKAETNASVGVETIPSFLKWDPPDRAAAMRSGREQQRPSTQRGTPEARELKREQF